MVQALEHESSRYTLLPKAQVNTYVLQEALIKNIEKGCLPVARI